MIMIKTKRLSLLLLNKNQNFFLERKEKRKKYIGEHFELVWMENSIYKATTITVILIKKFKHLKQYNIASQSNPNA